MVKYCIHNKYFIIGYKYNLVRVKAKINNTQNIECVQNNAPVAGKFYSVSLCFSFFSHNHFVQKPSAASTFAVMSNPHPADLPNGHGLNYKLIHLEQQSKQNHCQDKIETLQQWNV